MNNLLVLELLELLDKTPDDATMKYEQSQHAERQVVKTTHHVAGLRAWRKETDTRREVQEKKWRHLSTEERIGQLEGCEVCVPVNTTVCTTIH